MQKPYDIVIRFPNKKMAEEWCGQMSDGFGEGFCDFNCWQQKPDTDGTKHEHFEKITNKNGTPVYFVKDIFEG